MTVDRIPPAVDELPADLVPAPMQTINLELLRSGDEAEAKRLFHACVDFGFFYLDLREMSEGKFVETIDRMFELDEELYALPDEEKILYDVDKLGKLKINGWAAARAPPGRASR